MSHCFLCESLNTLKKLKIFLCFQNAKNGCIGSICVNKVYVLHVWFADLHSLHGQFSGFHFLNSLLKALIIVNFFSSRGTMFRIWGLGYEILSIPWKTLWILGKTHVVNIFSFFKNLTFVLDKLFNSLNI